MNTLIERLFPLEQYDTRLKQRRASALYGIASILLIMLSAAGLFVLYRLFTNSVIAPELAEPGVFIRLPIGIVAMILILGLVRRGRLRAATGVVLGVSILLVIGSMTLVPWGLHGALLAPALVIVLAALVTSGPVIILTTSALTVIQFFYMQASPEPLNVTAFVVPLETLAIGSFSFLLAVGWQRSLMALDSESEAQRLRMVELSTEITQRVFQRADLNSLLNETITLIRDRFDEIYHAQIFLLSDTGNRAILRASTGEAGRQLLQRGHYLDVGGKSVIGQATITNRPVLARDATVDTYHRHNDLLPETRTELALPMISPNGVIGVLDVQSMESNAFSPDDVSVLAALANQIAIAIEHANVLRLEQRTLESNQALTEQTQAQLEQIQMLNRQLTRQAWDSYINTQDLTPALTLDFGTGAMTPNAEWTPTLNDAIKGQDTVLATAEDGTAILAVPLRVHGQVIGAMEFELDQPSHNANVDQIILTQEVADRLALTLESTRIYEEAQQLAQREAIINNIGAQLQTTAQIESALAVAAQGLQSALNSPHIAIRLGTPTQVGSNGQEIEA